MEIYSAKEKDDVLRKLHLKSPIYLETSREVCIADMLSGIYITEVAKIRDDLSAYTLTEHGSNFLEAGGFTEQDRLRKVEQKDKDTLYELQRENVQLSNNELIYNQSIRKWKYISLVLGVISALLAIYTFFIEH